MSVRSQDDGQVAYVGIYYWDSGTQVLQLFKRSGSSWEQLGGTYDSGALSAGIDLELAAVGSAITLSENGAVVISATDDSLADGTPGIMADGTASAGDWAGADVVQGVLLWYHHDQLGSTPYHLRRDRGRHLAVLDPTSEAIPADLLVVAVTRPTPYLYSPEEITALMATARDLAHPLKAATFEAFLGLLACTGM